MNMKKNNGISLVQMVIVCVMLGIGIMSKPIFAESVFLKDGSIIEGDIVKETDKAMTIQTKEGKTVTIQRKDILRTLVNESYKTKMYIMKSSKEVLGVYIVEEDNESYTYRTELQSAEEYKINKEEVLFISKIPPKDFIDEEVQKKAAELGIKKKYTREENLKWRAPFMRFGYSNIGIYSDSDINDAYSDSRGPSLFIDMFPWRFRNESGNGFDAMLRARVGNNYNDGIDPTDPKTQTFIKLYQVPISERYYSQLDFGQICGGVRYAYSMFYGILIQPYVYGLLQLFIGYDIGIGSRISQAIDEWVSPSKLGYQFGAGVDFGITSYFGLFIEGMYSYIDVKFKDGKTRNVDGYYIYYGITWRTSYGLIE